MTRLSGLALAAVLVAAPASAQIVQSVGVGVGGFLPRGFDSRVAGDTIAADLTATPPLEFNIGDFKGAYFFVEWNMQIGNHFEFGGGIGHYRSGHVVSEYPDTVRPGGQQDLRLSIVPISTMVRLLPFGSSRTAQAYAGVGVGALKWSYTESGQFMDANNNGFTDEFTAKGTSLGTLMAFGLRVPSGRDSALTLEWRYQFGAGRTGGLPAGFLGEKIDLGGGALTFGYLGRF